ncbi:19887_t:CDS:2, partial [Racocetra fulgida]
PQKNPTGTDPTDGTDDDDSDLVLKLIKRASSKRQKRKYTRRNTGSSIDVGDNHFTSRENRPKLGRPKNGLTSRHIPTPNHSPTDIRHLPNSSGGDTSNFRVISNSGTSANPATQLRWRSISVGGGPISSQSGEISPSQSILPATSSTSPTHKGNSTSRRKQSLDASAMGFDSFRLSKKRAQQKQERPQSPTNSNWSWSSQNILGGQDNSNIPFPYSELLLPPTTSDPKETIILLQEKLVKAVGMLEDNQRKIDMLENVVRQREDE